MNRNLLEPDQSLGVAEEAFLSHYDQYRSLSVGPHPREDGDFIRASAIVLELFVLGACTAEYASRRGMRRLSSADARECVEHAERQAGINFELTLRQAARALQRPKGEEHAELPPLSEVVRLMNGVLELCPIDALEQAAEAKQLEEWGHRCRVAYDAIQAFVLRNDPARLEQFGIVGREYMAGRLTLRESATLLGLHPTDAVALLEAGGFARAVETVTLQDSERASFLARIRKDRLERQGRITYSSEAVAREVVASERLEGVDTRNWIRREGHQSHQPGT